MAPLTGTRNLPNQYLTSAGSGWALVGDAGHHKDPCTGMGISDAFTSAALLAQRVTDVIDDEAGLDRALAGYQRLRDAETSNGYDLTLKTARLAPLSARTEAFYRRAAQDPRRPNASSVSSAAQFRSRGLRASTRRARHRGRAMQRQSGLTAVTEPHSSHRAAVDMPAWDFEVRRDDLRNYEVRGAALPSPALGESWSRQDEQVLLRVDALALSANNLTYAVTGDHLGYWQLFPAAEPWGRIPAWGVATVIESQSEHLREGERFFGLVPMSSHLAVSPVPTREGFRDNSAAPRPRAPDLQPLHPGDRPRR